MIFSMARALAVWRSPRGRRAINGLSVVFAVAVSVLAGRWLAASGWPLAGARPELVVATAALFLLAYGLKAYGWSRLFAAHERPRPFALAVAGGAASVSGVALPGRFDDAVRVAVVRRHPGCPAGVRALALSLFTLGLIEAVAIAPLASTAAAVASSAGLRIGLAFVAAAGVAAAAVVLVLPRAVRSARFVRFRLVRWVGQHWPSKREASKALAFVLASWLMRGVGLFLLLGALGLHLSFPLAIIFMCGGAASAALPIAPAGAATQAGAGAAVLIASGVSVSHAVGFAIAAQTLAVLVGAAIVLSAAAWHTGRRLAPRLAVRYY